MKKWIVSLCVVSVGSSACTEFAGQTENIEDVVSTSDSALAQDQRISYRAHVQNIGWQNWIFDPSTAGTVGQSRRLEAIEIVATKQISNFSICYEADLQDRGWQLPVCNGGTMGTTGEHRNMRQLAIWLEPNSPATTNCELQYRVHLSSIGWHDWVSEGMSAGCPGCSIQAVEIRFANRACN